MKKLDPNQIFVICTIKRKHVARDLNDSLDRKEFKLDDPRLTDQVCKAFADGLYKISDRCEEVAESTQEAMYHHLLEVTCEKLKVEEDSGAPKYAVAFVCFNGASAERIKADLKTAVNYCLRKGTGELTACWGGDEPLGICAPAKRDSYEDGTDSGGNNWPEAGEDATSPSKYVKEHEGIGIPAKYRRSINDALNSGSLDQMIGALALAGFVGDDGD